ncbi:MAG: PKD domain-containing protein [Thermodesulfovibrionales bacterium]|nr:PKD domain-containing protein [Thermodesulfovibrionales bacterium]
MAFIMAGCGDFLNSAPVANAGPDQNVATGSVVTLDGSGSSDADGNALTYKWTITFTPSGSTAVLSSSTAAKPTFTADMDGSYAAILVVNDGKVDSAADTVTVMATAAAPNSAPVANAGLDQNVATGSVVTLDGSGSSDANGDTLTYKWSITSMPSGSTAVLSSTTVAKPTFTADKDGSYVASLVVNDGTLDSAADTVTVMVMVTATDDMVYSYSTPNYNANRKMTRDVLYTGSGADGVWFTLDDAVYSYDTYTYDANGNMTRWVYYTGSGADGVWFTSDDVVYSYDTYTYDANGKRTRWVYYKGSGADGVWFTSDDVVYSYDTYTYDANGNMTRYVSYNGSGSDGVWFTSNDVVYNYSTLTYDANGNMTRRVYYNGSGSDGIWFARASEGKGRGRHLDFLSVDPP